VLLSSEDGFSLEIKEDGRHPAIYNGLFTTIAFLIGGFTSVACGWLGMKIATYANARTALEARKGMAPAFMAGARCLRLVLRALPLSAAVAWCVSIYRWTPASSCKYSTAPCLFRGGDSSADCADSRQCRATAGFCALECVVLNSVPERLSSALHLRQQTRVMLRLSDARLLQPSAPAR